MTQIQPRVVFQSRRFQIWRHEVQLANGETAERDSIQHPGAVVILPALADGRVCLIRNFRLAVGRKLIELPAGTLEPGEEPARTAVRELEEETGFRCGQVELLREIVMSPGILNERMYLYVATDLTEGPSRLELDEQIETLLVPWDQALAMVDCGEIEDAKTLVALMHYDRLLRSGSPASSNSP